MQIGIDGVPGTAAPIALNFMNVVGSRTGKMFPTGKARERSTASTSPASMSPCPC
ncbi:MAG: PrpF domain-containing protein [Geminicoccaceae bacterium]